MTLCPSVAMTGLSSSSQAHKTRTSFTTCLLVLWTSIEYSAFVFIFHVARTSTRDRDCRR